jgi:hypothetical protein
LGLGTLTLTQLGGGSLLDEILDEILNLTLTLTLKIPRCVAQLGERDDWIEIGAGEANSILLLGADCCQALESLQAGARGFAAWQV